MRAGTRIRATTALKGLPKPGIRRLRNYPFEVTLRGDRDFEILAEIFSRHCYEPPFDLMADRVLDLGANIGLFAAYALGELGAKEIVAVEPDPDNLRVLRQFVSENRAPVRIIEGCAGTSPGEIGFEGGAAANSRVAERDCDATTCVPVVDVFSLGSFDLVKMDIEGSEWTLLADERFPSLGPVVVMEWHDRNRGDLTVEQALGGHAYEILPVDGHVVWARRPNSLPARQQ